MNKNPDCLSYLPKTSSSTLKIPTIFQRAMLVLGRVFWVIVFISLSIRIRILNQQLPRHGVWWRDDVEKTPFTRIQGYTPNASHFLGNIREYGHIIYSCFLFGPWCFINFITSWWGLYFFLLGAIYATFSNSRCRNMEPTQSYTWGSLADISLRNKWSYAWMSQKARINGSDQWFISPTWDILGL